MKDNNKIILTTEKDQLVNITDPIQPTTINIFLAITRNNLDRLRVLIYSLLKYSKSNFNVYIMTDMKNQDEEITIFNSLINDRLKLIFLDSVVLNLYCNYERLNLRCTPIAYCKMLIPTLFSHLDRILYLDWDTCIIKEGIEWLYNIDFQDKYLAVSDGKYDCNVAEFSDIIKHEYKIFRKISDFYFNSGVMLFNIPKIIADKKDKEMVQILRNPPNSQNNEQLAKIKNEINYQGLLRFAFCDQSFFNWIFRKNDVLKCNKIFNSEEDNLFTINENRIKILKEQWEFEDYNEYFNNIIIAHYCGPAKPWYQYKHIEFIYHAKVSQKQIQLMDKWKHLQTQAYKVST